jgi:hypothetical protein
MPDTSMLESAGGLRGGGTMADRTDPRRGVSCRPSSCEVA